MSDDRLRFVPVVAAVGAFMAFLSAALVIWAHGLEPPMDDFQAYWDAGHHIGFGDSLYQPTGEFRYAPWFAWLWAPFTALPESTVRVGWYLLLLGASASVLLPMVRFGLAGWCAAGVMSVFFVDGAATGNVSPLMAAALFHALPNRVGPAAIAACASLKAVAIVLVIVYVGRREWASAAVTVALTAALVAPMLLYDVSGFAVAPMPTTYGLGTTPVLWGGLALIALGVAYRLSRTPFAWLAASLASLAASPHLFLHYFALIAPGLVEPPPPGRPVVPLIHRTGHRSLQPD
ncbi:MAG TPA: hypothetical protein VFQ81_10890 [Candidatus Limnocylindria bacterium]|nr:hypothetical protein [Candidatus Limnocylindria bacterium]